MTKLLAFDLGAESGRAVLGHFDGGRLRLEVLTRFANEPVRTLDALHWDVLRLYRDMLLSPAKVRGRARRGGLGRRGHLGRRFRPARPRRRAARQPPPLPRPAHRRRHGSGLRPDAARGVVSAHRHPVHALQFAVPIAGAAARPLAAAGRGRDAPVHAGPVPLLPHRRKGQRIHRRQHQPDARPRDADLGGRAAQGIRLAGADSGQDRAAGHGAGAAASDRSRRKPACTGRG